MLFCHPPMPWVMLYVKLSCKNVWLLRLNSIESSLAMRPFCVFFALRWLTTSNALQMGHIMLSCFYQLGKMDPPKVCWYFCLDGKIIVSLCFCCYVNNCNFVFWKANSFGVLCKACSTKEVIGIVVFSGAICSSAYLCPREPISQAIVDIKVFYIVR